MPPAGNGGGIQGGSMVMSMALSAFAAFGGLLYGYDTGTISGIVAMEDWLNTFGTYSDNIPDGGPGYYLTTGNSSLVVSILSAGTFVGALLAGPVGDLLGRKFGLITACAVFCVGVGLQLATSWGCFVAGRVIAGLGVGLVSVLVPMYQSECSPKKYRGLIVGLYQWAITIGLLLAAVVNECTKDRTNHSAWRTPIAVQFAWAAVLSVGMFLLPESPRYLLLKGRQEQARQSLARLTSRPIDSPEVDQECLDISMALEAETSLGKVGYLDLFKSSDDKIRFRVLTGMGLQAMQQLSGINFIFYYGTTFFQRSGISNPFTITIITDVVNVVCTIPGILSVDRFGRRNLLIYGGCVMLVCEYLVAIIGTCVGSTNMPAQRCLIAFVCIYIAAFAATWGPIAWVVCGEIFPLAVRGKAMSLSVASNWLWNFAIAYATPYLVNPSTSGVNGVKAANLGVKVFFIWGSTCVGCVLFAYFFVPETKGLSLEQVDLLYRESSIRNSNRYRQQMLESDETYIHHGSEQAPKNPKGDHLEHHEEKSMV